MAIWDKIISSPDKDKKKAQELWARASRYFDGKLYNRALKDLQEALTLDNSLAGEAVELMAMFNSQGADEQALSVGLALLKMNPTDLELMNKLGNTLRNLNSFEKAKNLYTRILKTNPNSIEAKYNLAACSFRIKTADNGLISQTRKVENLRNFRRFGFLGDREGYYPFYNEELNEEEKKRTDKERDALEKKKKQDEEQLSEEDKVAVMESQLAELKQDVAASPQSLESHFNLALYYDLNGMGDLAVQHYRMAREVNPKSVAVTNNLAVALADHQKNLAEAETLLLAAMADNRFERTLIFNLAQLYRRTGKAFQTLKYFVAAGDLLKKSLWYFDTQKMEELARQYYERRKYLEAVPMFENLAYEQTNPFWLEKLAVMYFNQKKEDEYINALKRLVKLDPNQLEARTKLLDLAKTYEDTARTEYERKNRGQAIQNMVKSLQIEEKPERWVDLAQWYEEDGEEILAENAMRRWKKMVGQDVGDASAAAPPPAE